MMSLGILGRRKKAVIPESEDLPFLRDLHLVTNDGRVQDSSAVGGKSLVAQFLQSETGVFLCGKAVKF